MIPLKDLPKDIADQEVTIKTLDGKTKDIPLYKHFLATWLLEPILSTNFSNLPPDQLQEPIFDYPIIENVNKVSNHLYKQSKVFNSEYLQRSKVMDIEHPFKNEFMINLCLLSLHLNYKNVSDHIENKNYAEPPAEILNGYRKNPAINIVNKNGIFVKYENKNYNIFNGNQYFDFVEPVNLNVRTDKGKFVENNIQLNNLVKQLKFHTQNYGRIQYKSLNATVTDSQDCKNEIQTILDNNRNLKGEAEKYPIRVLRTIWSNVRDKYNEQRFSRDFIKLIRSNFNSKTIKNFINGDLGFKFATNKSAKQSKNVYKNMVKEYPILIEYKARYFRELYNKLLK